MALNDTDKRILYALEDGLPICPDPFTKISKLVGISEAKLLARLQKLLDDGTLKRMGLVVRHHALGYTANAMVVWNVADDQVVDIATRIAAEPFVTLCYQRPRRLPDWPYNLFSMIHGRQRADVIAQKVDMVERLGLDDIAHDILFSKRQFKQTGAKYCEALA